MAISGHASFLACRQHVLKQPVPFLLWHPDGKAACGDNVTCIVQSVLVCSIIQKHSPFRIVNCLQSNRWMNHEWLLNTWVHGGSWAGQQVEQAIDCDVFDGCTFACIARSLEWLNQLQQRHLWKSCSMTKDSKTAVQFIAASDAWTFLAWNSSVMLTQSTIGFCMHLNFRVLQISTERTCLDQSR